MFALAIWIWEPGIGSYIDSLWFCFASATSIGYGDIVAVTFLGRVLTVILSVYSIAVIAIITAVITGFFMDLARFRANSSVQEFLVDLEHLPEMSKEELEQRIKELPSTLHAVLKMRQDEKYSNKQIAALLGIKETSVSTLLARARRQLLEEIKKQRIERQ